jgi:hypothetical protein
LPGADKFDELWLPLIEITIVFCIKDPHQDCFARFRDLQNLLHVSCYKIQNRDVWEKLFDKALFPVFSRLPAEINAQFAQSPNIVERGLMMIRVVFRVWLWAFPSLAQSPSFGGLCSNFVQYSLNFLVLAHPDLTEAVPELLSNAMCVMKEAGVFEGGGAGGDSRQKLWLDCRSMIEPVSPSFAASCRNWS